MIKFPYLLLLLAIVNQLQLAIRDQLKLSLVHILPFFRKDQFRKVSFRERCISGARKYLQVTDRGGEKPIILIRLINVGLVGDCPKRVASAIQNR